MSQKKSPLGRGLNALMGSNLIRPVTHVPIHAPVAGADINGRVALSAVTYSGFGYMVWDRVDATTWTGVLFDIAGKPINHCRLGDRNLSCGS